MKKKMIFAAMLSFALLSCEEKYADVPAESREMVSLEIKLLPEATKVPGEGGNEEKAVSGYQVLIYDRSSGRLEAYETPDASSQSVNMQCTTGQKDVVVLANAPDVSGISSYEALLKTKSRLSDNSVGRLVMEGYASPELTASGGSISVKIKRIVSKVVLDAVTVDFEVDAYDNMDFILKKVYLTNVAADKSYLSETADPTLWYNQIVQSSEPKIDGMVYDQIADLNIKGTKKYTTKHHFYCYPNPYESDSFSTNWSPRPPRLVIEATLGGVLYYYPVSLPKLEQNTRYYVSLHIARPGASSPEQDMDRYAVTFNIEVEEWTGPEEVSETI